MTCGGLEPLPLGGSCSAGGGAPGAVDAADVTYSNAVPPDTSTNVDTALVYRSTHLGAVHVVSTLADFPAAVAGVINIDVVCLITTEITLTAGDRIVLGENGALVGVTSEESGIFGDVDAALISGPCVCRLLRVGNFNLGANANDIEVNSLFGRTVELSEMQLLGTRAGFLRNIFGGLSVSLVSLQGGAGFIIDGIVGGLGVSQSSQANNPPGFIGWDVQPTCIIIQGIAFELYKMVSVDASEIGFRISDAAVLPGKIAPATEVGVQILSCSMSGPGSMLGEDAGYLKTSDLGIFTVSNPGLRTSLMLGDALFASDTPSEQSYPGSDWVPLNHENAGGADILELTSISERFSLFRNLADVEDWYLEYQGPQREVTADVEIDVVAQRDGGSNHLVEFRVTKNAAPGYAGWVEVEGSATFGELTNRIRKFGGSAKSLMSPGDRFRGEMRDLESGDGAELFKVQLIIEARP